jgi:adenylate cyclase
MEGRWRSISPDVSVADRGYIWSMSDDTSRLRQRLVAILSADAAGFSRLMAADEQSTVAALDLARAVFRTAIEAHQGRVVDMAGDSVLAVFDTAAGAVEAALAVQAHLDAAAPSVREIERMCFRIGIHLGDVIEKPDGTVYGDGVNIAARLQALADPGRVVVSEAVRGSLRGKVRAAYEDRGEHTVKNMADPVRVYMVHRNSPAVTIAPTARRVRTRPSYRLIGLVAALLVVMIAGGVAWLARSPSRAERVAAPPGALALPNKPSIAVLPFDNIGGDPEQGYFADGVTEDVITDLSKVAGLFVIARNSTFVYKGQARDVRDVARTLGVRYVLEGSVRRSGGDIRINAKLIDATTGAHVWADRYDGEMKNIFGLQDKVTRSVVAALAVELTKEESDRVSRRGTANADAYDLFLKGWQQYLRQTPESFRAAILDFNKAVERDPGYGRAYAALAATYWEAGTRYWDAALGFSRHHEARFHAERFLAKAMENTTPLAHQVASAMLVHVHQHEESLTEARRAIAADPNDPDGYVALANALTFAGRPTEAVDAIERAMRLNPHYPPHYLYQLGLARFGMNRLDEAAAALERALALNREDYWSQRLLLATYGMLNRRADAAKLLQSIDQGDRRDRLAYFDPLTVKAAAYWYPFARTADRERFAHGLRAAGVPE